MYLSPCDYGTRVFYKQIILRGGLPFEVKLPVTPLDFSSLSTEEIDRELEKGYREIAEGKTVSAEKAFSDLRQRNGI